MRMDLQSLSREDELVATFWAVAAVALYDFAGGLQFKPGIQEVAAFGTENPLWRQNLR